MRPESHEPLGTPLSSPGFPLVPLVEVWKVLLQLQITESFTEIETLEGVKTRPPDPTRTVVEAAEAFCTKAAQDNAAATMTVTVFMGFFIVLSKRGHHLFCSRKFSENKIHAIQEVSGPPLFRENDCGDANGFQAYSVFATRNYRLP